MKVNVPPATVSVNVSTDEPVSCSWMCRRRWRSSGVNGEEVRHALTVEMSCCQSETHPAP